jgi:hypothetical protein
MRNMGFEFAKRFSWKTINRSYALRFGAVTGKAAGLKA